MFDYSKLLNFKKNIFILAIIFGIIQIAFSLTLSFNKQQFNTLNFYSQDDISIKNLSLFDGVRTLEMNSDEELNYQIAKNHLNEHGYSLFNEKTKKYVLTAKHGNFTVFLYENIIKSNLDFDIYILLFFFISSIFHVIALLIIYKFLLRLGECYATLGFFLWALFPSVIFYIYPLFLYESICTSILVINFYLLNKIQYTGKINIKFYIIIITLCSISIMLRAHTMPIYIMMFLGLFLFPKKIKRLKVLKFFIITAFTIFILHIPVLQKTKTQFGKYLTTTQFGFELWEGNNPLARGSWSGSDKIKTIGLSDMPNLSSSSELKQSDFLKKKSLVWIFNNPEDFLILEIRKIIIYLLPQNYSVLPGNRLFNPLNFIVYLGFIFFIILVLLKKIKISEIILIISPILASIILSLVFFVGYRWRLYAEPFMVLSCVYSLKFLYNLKKNKLS